MTRAELHALTAAAKEKGRGKRPLEASSRSDRPREEEKGGETRSRHRVEPHENDKGQEDVGQNPPFIRIPDEDILLRPGPGENRELDRLHEQLEALR